MPNKLWQWQRGRQKTGYDKLLLIGSSLLIKFDCYLLRFPEGSSIPPHTDPVSNVRHYRLNIVIKQAKIGGDFICDTPIFATNRIKLFRPDVSIHSVTRVEKGSRYLISIGWIRKKPSI
jgi:hypothetical protein